MERPKRLLAILLLSVGFISIAHSARSISYPLYVDHSQANYLEIDSSQEWGTLDLNVDNDIANYFVTIDQDMVADSVYGQQNFYFHNFAFMSDITFSPSNINIISPTDESWTVRSPGGDRFIYELDLWAYDDSPEDAPSFNTLEFQVNNLPIDSTIDDFLPINPLVREACGYNSPWNVLLRFPDNYGDINTLRLYSDISDPPSGVSPVPEPSSAILIGIGLTLLVFKRKFNKI